MRLPLAPFDEIYDVHGPQVTRVGKESAGAAVPVFHRSGEGLRLCRAYTSLAGAYSLQGTAADHLVEVIRQFQIMDNSPEVFSCWINIRTP